MFDGGKAMQEPQEKSEEIIGKDIPMRVFSMPEELRRRTAVLQEKQKKEAAPEALQPIIIPVHLPAEPQPIIPKKRVSPVLIVLLILVLMSGTGVGVWWYVVTYASPPQIIETPTPEPDPVPTPDPEPEEPFPGIDTDSDGLTNIEELLYGTDFRAPDTDSDTFLDGNEVFHRYDPNGLAPSTLLDTGAVRVLRRADLPFTLYYPASWSFSAASTNGKITFRSEENGSIELSYEGKDSLTNLSTWMKAEGISTKGVEETMTKEGYPARSAEDGRTVYLDLGDWVVSAVYDLGDTMSIEFLQTFKMMMNSVDVIEDVDGATNIITDTTDSATDTSIKNTIIGENLSETGGDAAGASEASGIDASSE